MSYRKRQCECGNWVTTNALGRAAHLRGEKHWADLDAREPKTALMCIDPETLIEVRVLVSRRKIWMLT